MTMNGPDPLADFLALVLARAPGLSVTREGEAATVSAGAGPIAVRVRDGGLEATVVLALQVEDPFGLLDDDGGAADDDDDDTDDDDTDDDDTDDDDESDWQAELSDAAEEWHALGFVLDDDGQWEQAESSTRFYACAARCELSPDADGVNVLLDALQLEQTLIS